MFKEKLNTRTHGQMHDGQQAMTLARWPMTSGAKNYEEEHCKEKGENAGRHTFFCSVKDKSHHLCKN